MQPRRILIDLMLAASASALVVSGVLAQEVHHRTVVVAPVDSLDTDTEARLRRLDALRAELQKAYEELFELQVRYQASADDPAALDSLSVQRQELREQVNQLSKRIAEENAARRETVFAPQRPGEGDVYDIHSGEPRIVGPGFDPEELGRIIEGANGIGEVLALLGKQLENLEVDVSPERVRIDTGTGGKLSFTVPPELREELSKGMREIGRELNRALADSSAGARNWAELMDQLPERIGQGWPDRRERRRKVVAESAFSVGSDFEVAEDEIVQGDVLLVGGDAYVAGEVQGSVYVLFGDLLVEERGLVAQDAVSVGGRVVVDDRAEVLGRRMDFGDLGGLATAYSSSGPLAWALYAGRLAMLFVLLLVIYALFGDRMALMVEHGGVHPARTMLSGAAWFTAIFGLFVIASVGLAISIIGIPVVLVLALAMGLVSLMAYLAGCELVGRRLAGLVRPGDDLGAGWQAAAVGVVLFELPAVAVLVLGSIGVDGVTTRPLIGLEMVVRFLAVAIGFGAVVHTRLGRRREEPSIGESAPDPLSAGA